MSKNKQSVFRRWRRLAIKNADQTFAARLREAVRTGTPVRDIAVVMKQGG